MNEPHAATAADHGDVFSLLQACEQNWSAEQVRSELARDSGRHLVVEGGAILGWITQDVAEITMIAVHPRSRRAGIARRLLAAWEDAVRSSGAAKVWLDVRPSNIAALSLYESSGYRATGRRPRYYQDGEDALLMERDL